MAIVGGRYNGRMVCGQNGRIVSCSQHSRTVSCGQHSMVIVLGRCMLTPSIIRNKILWRGHGRAQRGGMWELGL